MSSPLTKLVDSTRRILRPNTRAQTRASQIAQTRDPVKPQIGKSTVTCQTPVDGYISDNCIGVEESSSLHPPPSINVSTQPTAPFLTHNSSLNPDRPSSDELTHNSPNSPSDSSSSSSAESESESDDVFASVSTSLRTVEMANAVVSQSITGLPVLAKFNGEYSEDWEVFMEQYSKQCMAHGRNDQRMTSLLPLYLGAKPTIDYKKLVEKTGAGLTVGKIREELGKIYRTSCDVGAAQLSKRRQGPRESLTAFFAALHEIINSVYRFEKPKYREKRLLEAFMNQIWSADLRRLLLTKAKKIKTADQAIKIALEHEAINKLAAESSDESDGEKSTRPKRKVNQIRTNDPDIYTEALAQMAISQKQKRGKCFNCNRTGHYARDCLEQKGRNRSGHQQPRRQGYGNYSTGRAQYPIIPENQPLGDYNPRTQQRPPTQPVQRYGYYNPRTPQYPPIPDDRYYGDYNPRAQQYPIIPDDRYYGDYNPRARQHPQRPMRQTDHNQGNYNPNRPKYTQHHRGSGYKPDQRWQQWQPQPQGGQTEFTAKGYPHLRQVHQVTVTSDSDDDLYWDGVQYQEEMYEVGCHVSGKPATVNTVLGSTAPTPSGARLNMVLISLILICGAMGITNPTGPLLCGRAMDLEAKPFLMEYPPKFECSSHQDSNLTPFDISLDLYQRNMLEYTTKAFHCSKYRTTIVTSISFFTDVKLQTQTVEQIPVSVGECLSMARNRQCTEGVLTGHDGVFTTKNNVNLTYEWCCKEKAHLAVNCGLTETVVYKRFNQKMESPAGDVSACRYEDRACALPDKSILLWFDEKNSSCEFMHWRSVKRRMHASHFLGTDGTLALTFLDDSKTTKDCQGNDLLISDQGVPVHFTSTLKNVTVSEHSKIELHVENTDQLPVALQNIMTIVGAQLQSVSERLTEAIKDSFWQNYSMTCNNLVEYLEILKTLMAIHPTQSMRHILNNSNIFATAGMDVIEVYGCKVIPEGRYTLKPINDTCTQHLPIRFTYLNNTFDAYLDVSTNVIVPHSNERSCKVSQNTPVRINNTLFLYQTDGQLENPKDIEQIKFAGISLQAGTVKIPDAVYRTASLMDWASMKEHHTLTDIYAAMTRQNRVLQAMGVVMNGDTVAESADASIKNIFHKGWFSFLTGGKLGNWYELWVCAVCILVTMAMIWKCVRVGIISKQRGFKELLREELKWTHAKSAIAQARTNTDAEKEPLNTQPVRIGPPSYPALDRVNQLGDGRIDVVSLTANINDRPCNLLFDTGASISLIHQRLASLLGLRVEPTATLASGVTGHNLHLIGQCEATVQLGPRKIEHRFAVTTSGSTELVLVGTDFMKRIGAVLIDFQGGQLKIKDQAGRLHTLEMTGTHQ